MTETEILFSELLGCDRLSLYLNHGTHLRKDQAAFLSGVLKRRVKREPLQYILGRTEFMGLEFFLTEDVLIPRPETEILVDSANKYITDIKRNSRPIYILDIGTGSGCIAVSLAKLFPDAVIDATDISQEALKLARKNARLNGVSINFMESDLFPGLQLRISRYDLIITNPPYVATQELKHLQPEVRREPVIALDGGRDGLAFYRRIIAQAPRYLKKDGFLIMEMGFNQSNAIQDLIKINSKFDIIELVRDYNSIERVVVTQNLKKYG